jgi:CO dehydrogenase maturation factor
MLRQAIDRIGDSYRAVVIDNEAGMEHISRQTTRDVDWLFIISDPSHRGLQAAEQIVRLISSLGNRIAQAGLIINRVVGELPDALRERALGLGVPLLGILPHDPVISRRDAEGLPLIDVDGEIYPAVRAILQTCLGPQPEAQRHQLAKEEAC